MPAPDNDEPQELGDLWREGFKALLAGHPDALAWVKEMLGAGTQQPSLPDDCPTDKIEAAKAINTNIAHGLALAEINEKYGFSPTVADYKRTVEEAFLYDRRKISWGEELLIASEVYYKHSMEFDCSGESDTPKERAIVVAEIVLRAAKVWEREGEPRNLEDYIAEAVSSYSGDPGTPRKAIQRFRKKAEGQQFFRFNPDTFFVEVHSHEILMRGTSRSPGRPRKKS